MGTHAADHPGRQAGPPPPAKSVPLKTLQEEPRTVPELSDLPDDYSDDMRGEED